MAKFLKRKGRDPQGDGHLDSLTEIEMFKGGLVRNTGVSRTEVPHDAAKVAAQLSARNVIPNIKAPQCFRQLGTVACGQCPLRKIIGKAFGEEVMPVQALECVVKNRSVTAIVQAAQ